MKIKLHRIAFVLFILYFGSCGRDNFLDIQPRGVIIPSTTEDFRLLLDQGEARRFSDFSVGFAERHTQEIYKGDDVLFTEELVAANGFTQEQINLYLFEPIIYQATQSDSTWELYYQQIFVSNIILEGLDNVTDGSPAEIALLRAEARMHRAYAFFNLVNVYSVHYDLNTANSDLGVPLRLTAELQNVDLSRASVQEVYDFILAEVQESISDLPDVQPANLVLRPSQAAAYGLLAKIFLYQGRYSEALTAVEETLVRSNRLRDINDDETDVFPDFPIARFFPLATEDVQVIWQKGTILDVNFSSEYGTLFEENDLRNQWIAPTREFDFIDVDAFTFVAGNGSSFGTADGIITSDMYLIRSECNARLGNLTAANDDLNALRMNRFETGTFTPVNIANANELLTFIKEERRRELPISLERTFDIKRYNRFDSDDITISRSLGSRSVTIPPNSPNWAQPIGLLYINQNPEIEQNPRN